MIQPALPPIGLGTWRMRADATNVVATALGMGYRLIDTASGYVNEREVGAGAHASGIARDQYLLSTKFPGELAGQELEVLAFSLKSLRTPYVDSWLIHGQLPRTQLRLTWARFLRARDQGLASAIGVCNFTIKMLDWIYGDFGEYPQLNQRFVALDRDTSGVVTSHAERGIELVGHSPLTHAKQHDHEITSGGAAAIIGAYGAAGIPVLVASRSPLHLASNLAAALSADLLNQHAGAKRDRRVESPVASGQGEICEC